MKIKVTLPVLIIYIENAFRGLKFSKNLIFQEHDFRNIQNRDANNDAKHLIHPTSQTEKIF